MRKEIPMSTNTAVAIESMKLDIQLAKTLHEYDQHEANLGRAKHMAARRRFDAACDNAWAQFLETVCREHGDETIVNIDAGEVTLYQIHADS